MTRKLAESESGFQRSVVDLAHMMGWLAYHTHDSRHSVKGFPDLVLTRPNDRRVIFAELKTTTGRVSPHQHEWLAALRAARAEVYVWRPVSWPEIERTLARPKPTTQKAAAQWSTPPIHQTTVSTASSRKARRWKSPAS